jgi:hypothetical protein
MYVRPYSLRAGTGADQHNQCQHQNAVFPPQRVDVLRMILALHIWTSPINSNRIVLKYRKALFTVR